MIDSQVEQYGPYAVVYGEVHRVNYTLKKKRYFTEPLEMFSEVCRIQKTSFQIYRTFKGSSLGYTLGTFKYETFLSFVAQKKVS